MSRIPTSSCEGLLISRLPPVPRSRGLVLARGHRINRRGLCVAPSWLVGVAVLFHIKVFCSLIGHSSFRTSAAAGAQDSISNSNTQNNSPAEPKRYREMRTSLNRQSLGCGTCR